MTDKTLNKGNFQDWAIRTYENKKEAVEFLVKSADPFEKALGVLIKRYAGCKDKDDPF